MILSHSNLPALKNMGQGEKGTKWTNCSPTKNELVHEQDHQNIFHEIQLFSSYLLVLTQNSKKSFAFQVGNK